MKQVNSARSKENKFKMSISGGSTSKTVKCTWSKKDRELGCRKNTALLNENPSNEPNGDGNLQKITGEESKTKDSKADTATEILYYKKENIL